MANSLCQQIFSLHAINETPNQIRTRTRRLIQQSTHPKAVIRRLRYYTPHPSFTVRASKPISGLIAEEEEEESLAQIKMQLYESVKEINRGIFGVTSAKKAEIEVLVRKLESENPTPNPTLNLDKVVGKWKLVYSTITILGSKRTKLGLRDLISLGDFFQTIDVSQSKAVNVIKFNVRGFKMLNGQLTIEASFKVSSESRVAIDYDSSSVTPDQLMNVFRKNYDLLLGIFNPEGWLEITYLDDTMRIGRDDKGNIFILERSEKESDSTIME